MATISLINILDLAGIHIDDVVAVRHSSNDEQVKKCWNYGREMLEEYQHMQPKDFFKGKKYVLSFIGETGTAARFIGCYEVGRVFPVKQACRLKDFPVQSMYTAEDSYYYELEPTDFLKDLNERLVIDWGKSTLAYVQYSKDVLAKKSVISIAPDNIHSFPGYDKVLWSFDKMSRYLKDKKSYVEIYEALSAVNGIYLVVDKIDGKQYIGSAYGKEGIYGRWLTYAKTHGKGGTDEKDANKGMEEHLNAHPDRYHNLEYSILEIIHRVGKDDKDMENALIREELWKKKLGTSDGSHGLNRN